MNEAEAINLFKPLWADISEKDQYWVKKPLLAHYTSIPVLESMLTNNEIWLSNPLFMNDIDEVRFGISNGFPMVLQNSEISDALHTPDRVNAFRSSFAYFHNIFVSDHAFDTYVFCLSEHDANDFDGKLSMWRGYGGNGNGSAIVFDATNAPPIEESPFIIAKVQYANAKDRIDWLNTLISLFVSIIKGGDIPDDKLYLAAFELFERIKLFSLYTKHHGFIEEKEWRLVYLTDRDTSGKLKSMFDYDIGPRGIEPKLKFKVAPIDGVFSSLSLTGLIERIILGPSISSPLAKASIERMFDKMEKPELKRKIFTSTIPFRAI